MNWVLYKFASFTKLHNLIFFMLNILLGAPYHCVITYIWSESISIDCINKYIRIFFVLAWLSEMYYFWLHSLNANDKSEINLPFQWYAEKMIYMWYIVQLHDIAFHIYKNSNKQNGFESEHLPFLLSLVECTLYRCVQYTCVLFCCTDCIK